MNSYLRPNIRAMAGYTPGEQPRAGEFIKLNTNENPYPPSPRVLEALRDAVTGDRLRKYPDPLGTAFRQATARVLNVDPDGILGSNGSDDILTVMTRAFVPEGGVIATPTPGYLLYRTLAEIQEARFETVPFTHDWKLPVPWPVTKAHLTFLANPNSPSGTVIPIADLEKWLQQVEGPVLLDEAYADFAESNGLSLLGRYPVVVTRTMSKSYALAGMRFGFAVAEPRVIHELIKVKDSYNCDVLSLIAAQAAIEDQAYMRAMRDRIIATRTRMSELLPGLGFTLCPSQANFVWCRRQDKPVKPIYEALKERRILIRYMAYEGYGDGLRISVGTDAEIDQLLDELQSLV